MKILQVIYALGQGGAERFVLDLTNELAKTNEVYLIILRNEGEENDFFKNELSPNVIFESLNFKPGTRPQYLFRFFNIIKKIQPDVVHSHLNTILFTLIPSILFRRIKFFHTVHNDAKKEATNPLFAFFRKIFFKNNLIHPITISDESKASFLEFYGFDNSTLIYNGRTVPLKTPKFDLVRAEVELLKPDSDCLVFIHVARFAPQKNQEMLIRVFNRLLAENEPLILLVIGYGFDLKESKHLIGIASEGIHFLGAKKNVSDYLFLSDAFCLSSNFEGMPISLLEALACRCIPICTPVGGIVNIIENKNNGFLSENTDEDSYYLAVKNFLNEGDKINRDQLEALFVEKFSIDKCARLHITTYSN